MAASQPEGSILLITDKFGARDQLASILGEVCPVRVVALADVSEVPHGALCVVIDIELAHTNPDDDFQLVRCLSTCPSVPTIFVVDRQTDTPVLFSSLAKAKALGATNYITRPIVPAEVLRILPEAYGMRFEREAIDRDRSTELGVAAAHRALISVFELSRTGRTFTFDEVKAQEILILDALLVSGIKSWLETVRQHHSRTYTHSLLVTGVAVAFAQKLGMHQDDQKRVARAGLLHDIGKAFTPLSILDKPEKLSPAEMEEIKKHPVSGYEHLVQQGGFPEEILDCVRHHHELLDGSGYPDGLRGTDIADLVRIITIADIFSALIERRSYKPPLKASRAFAIMEQMGGKLDGDLLRAFHPIALEIGD